MRAPMTELSEDELELDLSELETSRPDPEADDSAATELDVLGQYLKETHRYPLLNREQEQKVSRAMRRSPHPRSMPPRPQVHAPRWPHSRK